MAIDVLGQDFIGQRYLRNRLNFMVGGYVKTGFIENLLFASRYGAGKTFACRKIMDSLFDRETNQPKRKIEINSASLQNTSAFFDQVIVPYVSNNQKVSIFFDEIDCANPKVHQTLLSVLQYDPDTKKSNVRDARTGVSYDFSFHNLTILASTTDPQRIHPALLNRFRCLEMQEYSQGELCKMLQKYTANIKFLDNIQLEIIKTARKSPRHIALRLVNDINQFCSQKQDNTFSLKDWNEMSHFLRILPHGINENELSLLNHLKEGACTLTNLCGKIGMQPQALRRNVELYLLAEGYLKIDNKRLITQKGMSLLEEIEKW